MSEASLALRAHRHDVFLSHSSKNKTVADTVCAALEQRGIRCWIAPRDIMPGQEWAQAIIRGIAECRCFVLIFSASSNASAQVRREVERAANHEIPIIPFRIDDIPAHESLEFFISSPHWLDALNPPLETHASHLADVVQAFLNPGTVPDPAALAATSRPAPQAAQPTPAPAAAPTPAPEPPRAAEPAPTPTAAPDAALLRPVTLEQIAAVRAAVESEARVREAPASPARGGFMGNGLPVLLVAVISLVDCYVMTLPTRLPGTIGLLAMIPACALPVLGNRFLVRSLIALVIAFVVVTLAALTTFDVTRQILTEGASTDAILMAGFTSTTLAVAGLYVTLNLIVLRAPWGPFLGQMALFTVGVTVLTISAVAMVNLSGGEGAGAMVGMAVLIAARALLGWGGARMAARAPPISTATAKAP